MIARQSAVQCLPGIYYAVNTVSMRLSERMVSERKKKGLTQEELAEQSGVNIRTVQRIESEDVKPRAHTIKALALVLEINPEALQDSIGPAADSRITSDRIHLLQMVCLSCFSFLVVPFIHFLIPSYLLKRRAGQDQFLISQGRSLIRKQFIWVILLNFLMLMITAINLVIVYYLKKDRVITHWGPLFIMYFANAAFLAFFFFRIPAICRKNAV